MSAPPLDERAAAALEAAAIRLHERYSAEVVERWNVCPWARRAREKDDIARFALLDPEPDIAPTLAVIDRLEADPRRPPVAIVIYPRLRLDPRAFDEHAARVREADQQRRGGRPVYVSATFHPDYPLDARTPGRLVPFLRRSPDPSLQLVRLDVLDEARGGREGKFLFDGSPEAWAEVMRRVGQPPLAERIAIDNLATVTRDGAAAFEAAYRAIAEDRARTYAAIGVAGDALPLD